MLDGHRTIVVDALVRLRWARSITSSAPFLSSKTSSLKPTPPGRVWVLMPLFVLCSGKRWVTGCVALNTHPVTTGQS